MIDRLNLAGQVWRHFGWGWLGFRLGYALRQRSGLLARRLPASTWAEQPLASFLIDQPLTEPGRYLDYRRSEAAPAFFFTGSDRDRYQARFAAWDQAGPPPTALAEEISRGLFRYFSKLPVQHQLPPDWQRNPLTGQQLPADRHWSKLGDFGAGDIKLIWELSRFSFTFALVRAYWRSGDEQLAELFWQLVEDWQRHNPPQLGPNWKCGQETSFRVMAWCFGLHGFLAAPATTARRVALLAQLMAVSGQRIEANLAYALSQGNNHGISEGTGLWTLGLLFPELRPAARWREKGRQVLEQQGRDLIDADGSFSQHSVDYHRLMLHDYLWALRLGELHGQSFSPQLKSRLARATDWLYQVQDETGGSAPYYGQNDGALLLPLSNCDYLDFRPVLQAALYSQTGQRCYGAGPWDEDLLWLFGPAALATPVSPRPRPDLAAEAGGYYTLRGQDSFVFTRCARYRHRPGQADMLHVDLWWRGQNLALDAGTYSYNSPPPWNNPLAGTAHHNTVTVDGQDQMERAGKFLWLPWLRGTVRANRRSPAGHLAYWEGEHDGYRRLAAPVTHRRGIARLGDETWLILDRLDSQAEHHYRLHWLLPDLAHDWQPDQPPGPSTAALKLDTRAGPYMVQLGPLTGLAAYSLVRAAKDSPRGWRSAYYMHREPALSLAVELHASSACFWTLFSPRPACLSLDRRTLTVAAAEATWRADLELNPDRQALLLASMTIAGTVEDKLQVLPKPA